MDNPVPFETYRTIVERSLVGVYVIQDERFVYANQKFAQLFGYTQEQLKQFSSILDLIEDGDRLRVREAIRQRLSGEVESVEYTVRGIRKNGTAIVMDIRSVRDLYDGRPAIFGTVVDITVRKQMEEALKAAALLDPLTGLYNRRGFLTLAERQLKIARRKGQSLILLAADLDDLKTVNDTYGHAVGDEALIGAATVLRQTYREADIIARLGGDEFTVFPLDAAVQSVPLLLERLEVNLQRWREEHKLPFRLSLSTGSAVLEAGDLSQNIERLLAEADAQLYRQKRVRGASGSGVVPFWATDRE
ncbi:MAG: diguanylate cyclase [Acidobacteria bacterium]|nr:diguanylate cyclase [Acidobacteriota bacterium]